MKPKPDCILAKILDGGQTKEEWDILFPLLGEIINDMVPYSMQYFLGVVEEVVEDIDE